MSVRARCARWLLAFAVVLATGCATPPRTTVPADTATGPWSGRLALQVEDKQSQSFSAGFELKGSARAGELALFTPIGGTLAVLDWTPDSAVLRSEGKTRNFESVEALMTHATGAAIPVAALFDWLRGINTPVAGWQADLSLLGQGRLRARRLEPAPQADLRVVLDR
jgi:outer membrane lipoprotein LolB